jgi:hypothetical protein
MGVLAIGPLAMAAVVLAWFPETAWRELEELNPEDQLAPDTRSPALGAVALTDR